jgi:hypothetical protein
MKEDMMRKTNLIRVSIFSQLVIWALIITTFVMGTFPPDTQAMLAPAVSSSDDSLLIATRSADLQRVQTVLESKMIQQRLEEVGLTPEEVNARLSQLSDAQLHQLATQLDSLMPGGDGGLGILILVLAIAVLAVLFVYLFKRV